MTADESCCRYYISIQDITNHLLVILNNVDELMLSYSALQSGEDMGHVEGETLLSEVLGLSLTESLNEIICLDEKT